MWKYKGNTTKPGNPLWDEYVEVDKGGSETGRSTLTTYEPIKISNYDNCDHEFEYIDNGNSVACRKCGLGQRIILGLHKVVDGKVVTVRKL